MQNQKAGKLCKPWKEIDFDLALRNIEFVEYFFHPCGHCVGSRNIERAFGIVGDFALNKFWADASSMDGLTERMMLSGVVMIGAIIRHRINRF